MPRGNKVGPGPGSTASGSVWGGQSQVSSTTSLEAIRRRSDREEGFFGILYIMVKDNFVSRNFAGLILLAEWLQLMTFALWPSIPWGIPTVQGMFIWSQGGQVGDLTPAAFLVRYGLSAVALVVSLGAAGVVGKSFKEGAIHYIFPLRIVRTIFTLLLSMAFVPLLKILVSPLSCKGNDSGDVVSEVGIKCLEWPGWGLIVISSILMILFVPIAIVVSLVYYDSNPKSSSMLARVHGRVDAQMLFVKSALTISFVTLGNEYLLERALFTSLSTAWLAYQTYAALPFFQQFVNDLRCAMYTSVSVTAFVGFLILFSHQGHAPPSYSVYYIGWLSASVLLSIVAALCSRLHLRRASRIFRKINIGGESYRGSTTALPTLGLDVEEVKYFSRAADVEISTRRLAKEGTQEALQMVQLLFARGMEEFKLTTWVRVSYAVFLLRYVQSASQTMAYIQRARGFFHTPDCRFQIYMLEKEMMQLHSGRDLGVINNLEYSKMEREAREAHIEALRQMKMFWELLLPKGAGSAQLERLPKVAEAIHAAERTAENSYRTLLSRFPKRVKVLRNYAEFCERVKNNWVLAQELFGQADMIEEEQAVERRKQIMRDRRRVARRMSTTPSHTMKKDSSRRYSVPAGNAFARQSGPRFKFIVNEELEELEPGSLQTTIEESSEEKQHTPPSDPADPVYEEISQTRLPSSRLKLMPRTRSGSYAAGMQRSVQMDPVVSLIDSQQELPPVMEGVGVTLVDTQRQSRPSMYKDDSRPPSSNDSFSSEGGVESEEEYPKKKKKKGKAGMGTRAKSVASSRGLSEADMHRQVRMNRQMSTIVSRPSQSVARLRRIVMGLWVFLAVYFVGHMIVLSTYQKNYDSGAIGLGLNSKRLAMASAASVCARSMEEAVKLSNATLYSAQSVVMLEDIDAFKAAHQELMSMYQEPAQLREPASVGGKDRDLNGLTLWDVPDIHVTALVASPSGSPLRSSDVLNIWEAGEAVVNAGRQLLRLEMSDWSTNMSDVDASFFFLLSNVPTNISVAFEKAGRIYKTQSLYAQTSSLNLQLVFMGCLMGMLGIVAFFVLRKAGSSIEREKRSVLQLFLEVPRTTVQQMYEQLRLILSGEMDADFERSQGANASKSRYRNHVSSDVVSKKSRLLSWYSLRYGGALGLVIVAVGVGYALQAVIAEKQPSLVGGLHLVGEQRILTRRVRLLVGEMIRADASMSSTSTIRSELLSACTRLEEVQRELKFGAGSEDGQVTTSTATVTSEYGDILHGTSWCTIDAVECAAYDGLDAMTRTLVNSVRELEALSEQGITLTTTHPTFVKIKKLEGVLWEGMDKAVQVFQQSAEIVGAQNANTRVIVLVVDILVLLLSYRVFFIPMLSSLRVQGTHTSTMLLMIPPVVIEKVEAIREFFETGRAVEDRKLVEAQKQLQRSHDLEELCQNAVLTISHATTSHEALQDVLDLLGTSEHLVLMHVSLRASVVNGPSDDRELLLGQDIWFENATGIKAKEFRSFVEHLSKCEYRPGEGVPGRVLESKSFEFQEDLFRTGDYVLGKLANIAEIKACAAFPMLSGNRVMGVIELYRYEAKEPDSLFITTMNRIGSELGGALIREQHRIELQRQLDMVALLQKVSVASTKATSSVAALTRTVRAIASFFEWEMGHAWLRDGQRMISIDAWTPTQTDEDRALKEITMEVEHVEYKVDLPGMVLACAKPVWAVKLSPNNCPRFVQAASTLGYKAAVAFPTLHNGEVTGALEFFSNRPIEISRDAIGPLERFSLDLGESLRRFEQSAMLKRAEKLRSVGVVIVNKALMSDSFQIRCLHLIRGICDVQHYAVGHLYARQYGVEDVVFVPVRKFLKKTTGQLASNYAETVSKAGIAVAGDGSLISDVALEGHPIHVDLSAATGVRGRDVLVCAAREMGASTLHLFPVGVPGNVHGVIVLVSLGYLPLDDALGNLLQSVGRDVGAVTAVEVAQSERRELEAAHSIVYRAAELLSGASTVEVAMHCAVSSLVCQTYVDMAHIWRIKTGLLSSVSWAFAGKELEVRMEAAVKGMAYASYPIKDMHPVLGEVEKADVPILVKRLKKGEEGTTRQASDALGKAADEGMRMALALPVTCKGSHPYALIELYFSEPWHPTPEWMTAFYRITVLLGRCIQRMGGKK